MKITNIHGMPDAVVEAVRNDPYSRGDSKYSVSDLVTPPRIVHLTRRHDDEISVDVVDRFWALFGQVAHGILERAGGGGEVEKRYFADIDGVTVSGQVDLIKDGIIYDYKTTSADYRLWFADGRVGAAYELLRRPCRSQRRKYHGAAHHCPATGLAGIKGRGKIP